eukprot:CAMPEP_0169071092 /NCGR_PEP_ID=MMETSP1015-20121227/5474_1 /TAXON_ID=342587 /ORGANISM="Karlodinium micrum, Strain CCMP2283" /LENGTH=326 /DNA_ID=CAMNT_0009130153 /DNA_START=1 /DNA_END=982 /DNA_ORIENTATION=+
MAQHLSVLVIGDGDNLRPSRQLLDEAKNQGISIHIDSIDINFDLTKQNKPGNIETEFEMIAYEKEEDAIENECMLREIVKRGGRRQESGCYEEGTLRNTIRLKKAACQIPQSIQERLAEDYDLCFMLETIQFIEPPDGSVEQEVIKRLRIGGRAIISAAEAVDVQKNLLSAITLLRASDPELKRSVMMPSAARAISRAPGVGRYVAEHFDDMLLAEKFTVRSSENLLKEKTAAEMLLRGVHWLHPRQKSLLDQHAQRLTAILDAICDPNLRYEVGLWVLVKSGEPDVSSPLPLEFQAHPWESAQNMREVDDVVVEKCCNYIRARRD